MPPSLIPQVTALARTCLEEAGLCTDAHVADLSSNLQFLIDYFIQEKTKGLTPSFHFSDRTPNRIIPKA
jgi:hypothetical protein